MPLPEKKASRKSKVLMAMPGKEGSGKVWVTFEKPDGSNETVCITDDGSFERYKVKEISPGTPDSTQPTDPPTTPNPSR